MNFVLLFFLLNSIKKNLQVNFEINDKIFGTVLLHRDHRISSARNALDQRQGVFGHTESECP